jgi:enamine deaminase RidA (YjgF/YER057c/UK114 family)
VGFVWRYYIYRLLLCRKLPMSAERRIQELGLVLPAPPKAMGVYRPVVLHEHLAWVSGHGPLKADGKLLTGRVGDDLSQQDGYEAARVTGLAMLASLRAEFGSLDRIHRLVKTFGMVQCSPDFKEIPAVMNGFSELMRDVFGPDRGVGARSAVGMISLPGNIPVEVDAVFTIGEA